MTKKKLIILIIVLALLVVLFTPVPTGKYGNTKEYTALTYKIIKWDELVSNGRYRDTDFYFFPKNYTSIYKLWDIKMEEDDIKMPVMDKPVLYLYPEEETTVDVKLDLDGELTCTYPEYTNGWKVTAMPDGTLIDGSGKEYNYLYWEGVSNIQYDMSRGFCVKGEDTAQFLEDALERLGLNRREANEFIVYWLPLMEQNNYNIISFQSDAYTDAAKLEISPMPDTIIRVFMTWYGSESYVNIDAQDLSAQVREGFTVVEWGGSELK